jgi:mono/diheme cytochrome c family protein
MRIELKATAVAAVASFCALVTSFAVAGLLRSTAIAHPDRKSETGAGLHNPALTPDARAQLGRELFERNCAHCHGDDARGDEGPNLHNLTLSDARIAKRIKEGIKGEMPSFGSKFNDGDINALTVYLRSLKE